MKIKQVIGPYPPTPTARHNQLAIHRLPPSPYIHQGHRFSLKEPDRKVVFLSQVCYDSLLQKRSGPTRKRIVSLHRKKHNLCIITRNILVVGSIVPTLHANLLWECQRRSESVQFFATLFCRLRLVIAENTPPQTLLTNAVSLYLFGV
jgi:hypothetical protein